MKRNRSNKVHFSEFVELYTQKCVDNMNAHRPITGTGLALKIKLEAMGFELSPKISFKQKP